MAAGQRADLLHHFFNDAGDGQIVGVGRFAVLEIHVRVLGGAGLVGMLGVQRAAAESLDGVPVNQLGHFFIFDLFDLLHFVAGAEAVKEVEEGN